MPLISTLLSPSQTFVTNTTGNPVNISLQSSNGNRIFFANEIDPNNWDSTYTSWNSASATSIVSFNDTRFAKLSSQAHIIIGSGIQPTYGNNHSCGYFTTVGGGLENCGFDWLSTVAGGFRNYSCGYFSSIGGGIISTASGYASTVSGGGRHTVSGNYANIAGGKGNNVSGNYANIAGGSCNSASGEQSTVSGGYANIASGNRSTVSGGYCNTAFGNNSNVSGGYCNTASGYNSNVSGGSNNTASGNYSNVAGGLFNNACGFASNVAGVSNNASNFYSNVAGGAVNTASGSFSNVVGGYINTASGGYSNVAGGCRNIASGDFSTILGGQSNNTNNQANTFILGSNITAPQANYTYVNNLSSQGLIAANGGNSDNWNSVFSSWNSVSAFNLASRTFVNSNSANILQVNTKVNTTSANWDSTFTTVFAVSASWGTNLTAKTIYVDTNGTDTRNTFSAYDSFKPFATIAAAIAASTTGDTIYVRAGSHSITSQISLNGKGNIYFELGARVTVSNNIVAFSLTANEPKTISGYSEFTCSGTGGLWTQSGGTATTQLVNIQCLNITNLTGVGIIFDIATGIVGVDAPIVACPASTIVNITGTTSDCFYNVNNTHCGKLVNIASTVTTGGFTANCWTVQIYGTEGIRIDNGVTSFRVENIVISALAPAPIRAVARPVVFGFTDGSITTSSHTFRGGRILNSFNNNPCITFNATTATNKSLRLIGDIELDNLSTATVSISSANSRNIIVSHAHATKPVSSNITIQGGTYIVDPIF